jgi:DNA-binding transcriptional ArsR family regulator
LELISEQIATVVSICSLFAAPRRTGSPSLLPLLRSRTQPRLVERLFLHDDHRYTVDELARALDVTPMSVRRELDRMLDAGIVERERIGRQRSIGRATPRP